MNTTTTYVHRGLDAQKEAVEKFTEDSLVQHGIVPWWIQTMLYRLTEAFKEKNELKIDENLN